MTTTTSITTLADSIMLGACPDNTIYWALRQTGYEFCRRTGVWRETLASAALAANAQTATFALGATVDGIIAKVVSVTVNDGTDYRKEIPEKYYEMNDSGVLTWKEYFASAGDVLSADVVVWPTLACEDYPNQIINRHGLTLIEGAKARLQAMNAPWRDEAGARLSADNYESGVRRAILGKSRKAVNFFRQKPPTTIISVPGTPLSGLANYESTTPDS